MRSVSFPGLTILSRILFPHRASRHDFDSRRVYSPVFLNLPLRSSCWSPDQDRWHVSGRRVRSADRNYDSGRLGSYEVKAWLFQEVGFQLVERDLFPWVCGHGDSGNLFGRRDPRCLGERCITFSYRNPIGA